MGPEHWIAIAAIFFSSLTSITILLLSSKRETQLRQLEAQRQHRDQHLVIPIIEFVDELVKAVVTDIHEAWALGPPSDDKGLPKELAMRIRHATVRPRVIGLKHRQLRNAFDSLCEHYRLFLGHLYRHDLTEAESEAKEVQVVATVILLALEPSAPRHREWWRRLLRK